MTGKSHNVALKTNAKNSVWNPLEFWKRNNKTIFPIDECYTNVLVRMLLQYQLRFERKPLYFHKYVRFIFVPFPERFLITTACKFAGMLYLCNYTLKLQKFLPKC